MLQTFDKQPSAAQVKTVSNFVRGLQVVYGAETRTVESDASEAISAGRLLPPIAIIAVGRQRHRRTRAWCRRHDVTPGREVHHRTSPAAGQQSTNPRSEESHDNCRPDDRYSQKWPQKHPVCTEPVAYDSL